MKEPRDFLEKAAESIDAADLLLKNGYLNIAASRAYYASFYIAQALLFSLGFEYSSHRQVVAQYGRYFSKTRLLDPAHHSLLLTSFDLRQFADYQVEETVKAEVVSDLIAGGRRFLQEASDYLANLPNPQSNGDT